MSMRFDPVNRLATRSTRVAPQRLDLLETVMIRARWAMVAIAALVAIPTEQQKLSLSRSDQLKLMCVVLTAAAGLHVMQRLVTRTSDMVIRFASVLVADLILAVVVVSMAEVDIGGIGVAIVSIPIATAALRFGYPGALAAWTGVGLLVGVDIVWSGADQPLQPTSFAVTMGIVLAVGGSIAVLGETLIDEIVRLRLLARDLDASTEPRVVVARTRERSSTHPGLLTIPEAVKRAEHAVALGRQPGVLSVVLIDNDDARQYPSRSDQSGEFADEVEAVIKRRLLSAVGTAGFVVTTSRRHHVIVVDSTVVGVDNVEHSVRAQLGSPLRRSDGTISSIATTVERVEVDGARSIVRAFRSAAMGIESEPVSAD